ncbi:MULTISPECIES: glutamate ABC transporter substrate-binding protein [unclassified Pseudonocardia]|uniref:glutamate ABC transporter substrate-binding protein n=1 Tax=unclassified Pseudonocardia TaxID=2619320 RepID=UPI0005BDB57C|nr:MULTISPECIES: glutamate ABC transporter substrate-binding protein [unclassified Pseudonocardia]KAA1021100.1 glutamate ABC transporter substrate-binding protein [Pseudonocardia sp. EV170527-09]OLL96758.1 putative glutamate binding protein [Pseudonocardia sp. Ae331_Ps2]OLM32786.1 putative glutamate binding protein [Pseudonocardia sp. Ae717_Ps2]
MKRTRILVAAALAATLALAGCGREGTPGAESSGYQPTVAQNVTVEGSPTFDAMKQRGRVVIGVKDDQPNLGFRDATTNEFSGFDIDIARMVAGGLGFSPEQIEYKVIPSAAREDNIERGDVDYYVGTYTINDKRKQRVGFAGPYYVAGQSLLVRADDNTITGPQTLQGKRVCSVTGSTPIQRVKDQKLTDQVVEFQTYTQCVDQLINNQVDAVTTDDAILLGYAAQNPEQLKVVGEKFSSEPYGIGVPKADTALRNKINDLLQAAIDDGTWKTIYDGTLGKSGTQAQPPAIERY